MSLALAKSLQNLVANGKFFAVQMIFQHGFINMAFKQRNKAANWMQMTAFSIGFSANTACRRRRCNYASRHFFDSAGNHSWIDAIDERVICDLCFDAMPAAVLKLQLRARNNLSA